MHVNPPHSLAFNKQVDISWALCIHNERDASAVEQTQTVRPHKCVFSLGVHPCSGTAYRKASPLSPQKQIRLQIGDRSLSARQGLYSDHNYDRRELQILSSRRKHKGIGDP